ncbi:MAG: tetratricopeptide repeat protein [Gemmataceae bacterium]
MQIDIAKYFMSQGEWKKAQPYADQAAATGAGWAMLAASDCYEGLEDWTKAEELVRSAAERYDDGKFKWYMWCRRTGHGDLEAAEKLFLKYVETLDDRYSKEDMTWLMTYYVMSHQADKAVEMVDKLLKPGPNESLAFLKITLLDAQDKVEARDLAIKQFPNKTGPYGQVVNLVADSLAQGDKSSLDERALKRLMRTMTPVQQIEILYLVAMFQDKHGDKEGAIKYLQRVSSQAEPKVGLFKTLAWVALRDRNITPEKPELKK